MLYSPPGAAKPGPRPLVVVLHGSGQPLQQLREWLPMEPIADRESFLVAYPDAINRRWSFGERPGEIVDDIGFIDDMLERLVAAGVADPARIYVAGISRGAQLTWALLCRRPERFAAAAALASPMTETQFASCAPKRLIPTLAIAGTADSVVPYFGSTGQPAGLRARVVSMPETIDFWGRLHGCTAKTMQPLPHLTGGDASVVYRVSWATCARGGPVAMFRIDGGEHAPPARSRGQDIDAAEEVWRFFRAASPAAK